MTDRRADRPPWAATRLAKLLLRLSCVGKMLPAKPLFRSRIERLGGQHFNVSGGEGAAIAALHLPARPAQARRLPVVMTHGWLEMKEFHLRSAALLASHGHDVILTDLRRHGASTGRCVTFGVLEKHDLAAVIDTARARGWVKDRVLTCGYSLGAAAVLQHAAIDRRVAAVVAFAPFYNMVEAVQTFHRVLGWRISLPYLRRGFEQACRDFGFAMEDASPAHAVQQLEVPILFFIGRRDRLLPDADHTARLVAAKHQGPVRHVEVPHAGHIDLCLRHRPEVDRVLVEFCAGIG